VANIPVVLVGYFASKPIRNTTGPAKSRSSRLPRCSLPHGQFFSPLD
jgi:hypothetical protein